MREMILQDGEGRLNCRELILPKVQYDIYVFTTRMQLIDIKLSYQYNINLTSFLSSSLCLTIYGIQLLAYFDQISSHFSQTYQFSPRANKHPCLRYSSIMQKSIYYPSSPSSPQLYNNLAHRFFFLFL
jgi:hypothetical protein